MQNFQYKDLEKWGSNRKNGQVHVTCIVRCKEPNDKDRYRIAASRNEKQEQDLARGEHNNRTVQAEPGLALSELFQGD